LFGWHPGNASAASVANRPATGQWPSKEVVQAAFRQREVCRVANRRSTRQPSEGGREWDLIRNAKILKIQKGISEICEICVGPGANRGHGSAV
jgi:hypothetical protein